MDLNKYTFQPHTDGPCDLLIFLFPSGRNKTAKSTTCDSAFEIINALFSWGIWYIQKNILLWLWHFINSQEPEII